MWRVSRRTKAGRVLHRRDRTDGRNPGGRPAFPAQLGLDPVAYTAAISSAPKVTTPRRTPSGSDSERRPWSAGRSRIWAASRCTQGISLARADGSSRRSASIAPSVSETARWSRSRTWASAPSDRSISTRRRATARSRRLVRTMGRSLGSGACALQSLRRLAGARRAGRGAGGNRARVALLLGAGSCLRHRAGGRGVGGGEIWGVGGGRERESAGVDGRRVGPTTV